MVLHFYPWQMANGIKCRDSDMVPLPSGLGLERSHVHFITKLVNQLKKLVL